MTGYIGVIPVAEKRLQLNIYIDWKEGLRSPRLLPFLDARLHNPPSLCPRQLVDSRCPLRFTGHPLRDDPHTIPITSLFPI